MMLSSAKHGQVVIRHAHPRWKEVITLQVSSVGTRGLRRQQEAWTLFVWPWRLLRLHIVFTIITNSAFFILSGGLPLSGPAAFVLQQRPANHLRVSIKQSLAQLRQVPRQIARGRAE